MNSVAKLSIFSTDPTLGNLMSLEALETCSVRDTCSRLPG